MIGPLRRVFANTCFAALLAMFAGDAAASALRPAPLCGQGYDGLPFPTIGAAAREERECPAPSLRTYQRRYSGLAYEVLDLESEACFVPDASFMLLDSLLDGVRVEADRSGASTAEPEAAAMAISGAAQRVLARRGFRLYIPTDTIGEALTPRWSGARREYLIDCDTFAIILLTVAESYALPAALVEISLSKTATHFYVRWLLPGGEHLDWDTNDGEPCRTPDDVRAWEGRPMTPQEVEAYILGIRAGDWKGPGANERALADLARAAALAPERPHAYNSFAWRVATIDFDGRRERVAAAIAAAERALSLAPDNANYLDTLACALALDGQFARASDVQSHAVLLSGGDGDFERRLGFFGGADPRDCTGE